MVVGIELLEAELTALELHQKTLIPRVHRAGLGTDMICCGFLSNGLSLAWIIAERSRRARHGFVGLPACSVRADAKVSNNNS